MVSAHPQWSSCSGSVNPTRAEACDFHGRVKSLYYAKPTLGAAGIDEPTELRPTVETQAKLALSSRRGRAKFLDAGSQQLDVGIGA